MKAGNSDFLRIADATTPFDYLRIMRTTGAEPSGCSDAALDVRVPRLRAIAGGNPPNGLGTATEASAQPAASDAFFHMISGHKVANPAAAMRLLGLLG